MRHVLSTTAIRFCFLATHDDSDWSRLQQGQHATAQYGAQVNYAARAPTVIVAGVVVNRDAMLDALQQPQIGFRAPAQYGGPVQYGAQVNFWFGTRDDRNRCRHGSRGIPDVLQ